jgi:hypothetical protein
MRVVTCSLVLLLVAVPALAGHPLTIDDAGTVDPAAVELELSSSMTEREFGTAHGLGVAARVGLAGSLDSGIGMVWFDDGADGTGHEFVVDLKFAPGRADRWRPRPFLRSDFAVLTVSGETRASLAGLCGGMTWELGEAVLSAETCWSEPLDSSAIDASAWSAAAGVLVPVHRQATVAAEFRRGAWNQSDSNVARLGVLTDAGRGTLSLGAELPLAGARIDAVVGLLGWTAEFGL